MTALPRRAGVAFALFLGFALTGPVSSAAQSVEASSRVRRALGALEDSSRVRLQTPRFVVHDGLFLGLRRDSVVVRYVGDPFTVSLDEVVGLDVWGARWRATAVQAGAVGLVAGAATGLFLAYFKCGDAVADCDAHAGRVALRWGLVFGAAGGMTGALVGSRLRHWRTVVP